MNGLNPPWAGPAVAGVGRAAGCGAQLVSDNVILNLVSVEKDGCIRVASSGNITAAHAHPGGKNPFETLLGANWAGNRVVLDLGRSEFIDSIAIGWLIGSAKQFRTRGGALVVHSIGPRVRQMLDLLQIGRLVPLVTDEGTARRFVSTSAGASAA